MILFSALANIFLKTPPLSGLYKEVAENLREEAAIRDRRATLINAIKSLKFYADPYIAVSIIEARSRHEKDARIIVEISSSVLNPNAAEPPDELDFMETIHFIAKNRIAFDTLVSVDIDTEQNLSRDIKYLLKKFIEVHERTYPDQCVNWEKISSFLDDIIARKSVSSDFQKILDREIP